MNKPRTPKVRLDISKEVIDRSIPRDSKHCMIADAVKTAYPTARHISVDLATIRFTDPDKKLRYTYLTPRIAQAALVNFDQARHPEPFSFMLRHGHVARSSGPNGTVRLRLKQEASEKSATKKPTGAQLDAVKKAALVFRGKDGHVPDRIGGRTAPLQRSLDNVPFSRRRAFGLRALEL